MRGINFKENNNEIVLRKKLARDETYKVSNRDNTYALIIYKKLKEAIGYTSLTESGKHIILLDFDNICKWIVDADLKKIIQEFNLSPFYIHLSKERKVDNVKVGNYHCVCLTKKHPAEIVEIQRKTHCDRAYITMPLRNIFKSWIIRTSKKGKRNKPKFIEVIGNENLDNDISEAHLDHLKRIYNIPKIKYTNLDRSKTLFKNVYKTGNV